MPLYEFECTACQLLSDFVKKMGDFEQDCPNCDQPMKKLISHVNINVGPVPITGYWDDTLQTYIQTNTHRKQVMEEQGVTEFGATPKLSQEQQDREEM
jgi:putative FmdB family regulatory protein